MILNLMRFDVHATFILLFNELLQMFRHDFCNVIDMSPAFGRRNRINKRNLLKPFV